MTRTQRRIEEHRKGDAVVEVRDDAGRPCARLPVWVEQESHAFLFGCAAPDLNGLPEADRCRCLARLGEVFNRREPPDPKSVHFDVPDRVHLGLLRLQLDRLAADGAPLDLHIGGQSVGMADRDEREAARRVTELYTLCFAHPAVRGIFWQGFWDGEKGAQGGLLRRDFSPTAAFRLLQKLIDVVWHTRADGLTDADGHFRFRGFYGDYRVGTRVGEETKVSTFSLRPEIAPTLAPIPAVF